MSRVGFLPIFKKTWIIFLLLMSLPYLPKLMPLPFYVLISSPASFSCGLCLFVSSLFLHLIYQPFIGFPKDPTKPPKWEAKNPLLHFFITHFSFNSLSPLLVENQLKRISNDFLIMKPEGFLLSSQTPFCSHGYQSWIGRVSCSAAVPSVSQVLNTGSFWGFSFLSLSLLIEFQINN